MRVRAALVDRDAGVGQAVGVVLADLDEALRDDVGLDAARGGVGVLVGDLAEVAEGLDRVLLDALAVLVHQAELPERHRLAGGGGILERAISAASLETPPPAPSRRLARSSAASTAVAGSACA